VDVLRVNGGLRVEYNAGALKVSPAAFGFGPASSSTPTPAPSSFPPAAATTPSPRGPPDDGSVRSGGAGGGSRAGTSPQAPLSAAALKQRARAYGSADGLAGRSGIGGLQTMPSSPCLTTLLSATAGASNASSSPSVAGAGGLPPLASAFSEDLSALTRGASPAESLHQISCCNLLFEEQETALAAAAAIGYARAAQADASRWLACGLPTNFAIELAGAFYDAASHPVAPSLPASFGALSPAAAARAAGCSSSGSTVALGPGPWGEIVELPGLWNEMLTHTDPYAPLPDALQQLGSSSVFATAAAAAAAAAGSMQQQCASDAERRSSRTHSINGYVREILIAPRRHSSGGGGCSSEAAAAIQAMRTAGGPAALVVHFSTPLGLAVARIRPEHLMAVQRDEALFEVLAVPVAAAGGNASSAAASSSALSSAQFSSGDAPAAAAAAAATPRPCFHHVVAELLQPKDASACDGNAVEVQHSQSMYAVLQIALEKAPCAAAPAAAVAPAVAAAQQPLGLQQKGAAASALRSGAVTRVVVSVVPILLALAVQYSLLTAKSLDVQMWLDALTIAVLAGVAADYLRSALAPTHSSSSSSSASPAAIQPPTAPRARATPAQWSVRIAGASLLTQPDAYVQMQIKEYKAAAAEVAEARALEQQRLAAARAVRGRSGAAAKRAYGYNGSEAAPMTDDSSEAGAVMMIGSEADRYSGDRYAASQGDYEEARVKLPMLISDPEPSWLTTDVHQRWGGWGFG